MQHEVGLLREGIYIYVPAQLFHQGWPSGIDRAALDPYYDLAAYMLDVAPLSEDQPLGLPERTRQRRRAVQSLGRGAQFFLPNLAISWRPPGILRKNKFGVEQDGCAACSSKMLADPCRSA